MAKALFGRNLWCYWFHTFGCEYGRERKVVEGLLVKLGDRVVEEWGFRVWLGTIGDEGFVCCSEMKGESEGNVWMRKTIGSSKSQSSTSSSRLPPKMCGCGEMLLLLKATTAKNKGRLFYRCRNWAVSQIEGKREELELCLGNDKDVVDLKKKIEKLKRKLEEEKKLGQVVLAWEPRWCAPSSEVLLPAAWPLDAAAAPLNDGPAWPLDDPLCALDAAPATGPCEVDGASASDLGLLLDPPTLEVPLVFCKKSKQD
ncbi:hypothetical protein V8G54_000413 [Vigna mungo]|uniref:Zinc finger GRF-type domain-containing protein n=1 Tax=Vigna mungo TaxID=3915 RepID=A0AAQ3P569_VIGMU